MKVHYHQDGRFGRADLEEDAGGRLLFSVSGPGRHATAVVIVLDAAETALFRGWGARYLDVLANRIRGNPAEFASRNLLPPPREPAGEEPAEGEAKRPSRPAVVAASLALLLFLLLLAWIVDPPGRITAEREGTARALVTIDGDATGERRLLRVELAGGEEVLVHASGEPVLREGATVTVRERRSRLFGKRTFVFVRYR